MLHHGFAIPRFFILVNASRHDLGDSDASPVAEMQQLTSFPSCFSS